MSAGIPAALAQMPDGTVTTDPDVLASRTLDFRRHYHGRTDALLRPRSVGEVRQIVRVCRKHGIPLVPQGGNTGYCTGATPDAAGGELVISLERMNRIRELDGANLSITADAGAVLANLQDAATEADLLLPLALGSQASCQIGGNVSTNAGGIAVLRYGMTRKLVLGLEVVLPNGSLFSDLSPLHKDNSGYDVKQLFIGAEGTLGIVTGVSLSLARRPRRRVTAFLTLATTAHLAELLARAQEASAEQLSSFEYVSRASLDLLLAAHPELSHPLPGHGEHYILMEAASVSEALPLEDAVTEFLSEQMEAGNIADCTLAVSERQRDQLWHLRENLPEGETHHGGSVKHDIAVRTSHVADFIERASLLVRSQAPDAILSVYGHVGDGNVHFNLVPPSRSVTREWRKRIEEEVSPKVHALAVHMGGTFSAEYGIGRTKRDLLETFADPGKIEIMRLVKNALDPDGLMNPQKVLPRR